MPRPKKRVPDQEGAPAARYPNRTDLAAENAAPTQPIRVPTGGPYGTGVALEEAQRAFPLPQPPDAPPASSVGAGVERLPGTLTPTAAQGYTPPDLGLGSRPTDRPGEPITAGLPIGAGPGPSPNAGGNFGAAALLRVLARATQDPLLIALAREAEDQGF